MIKSGDVSYAYKRGPHLHILGGDPAIDKSHVAVCVNDKNYGGANISDLTESLAAATAMISAEILPQYRFGS
jgi:hypothetical protein